MNDVGFQLFHGLLTSLGFPIPSVKCDHMVPRIVSEVMDTQIPLPGISLSFISKECSSAGGASRSARAPCGDAAGPRLGRSRSWGRTQQLRRRGVCAAQDVPVASGPASQGGTCTIIGQCGGGGGRHWPEAPSAPRVVSRRRCRPERRKRC